MILLFLMNEKSYNTFPDVERIYRLTDEEKKSSAVDYRVAQLARINFPQVEDACLVNVMNKAELIYNKNLYSLGGIMSADDNFFKFFSAEFIAGNSQDPFADSASCILTESAARKIFAKENPIGRRIRWNRTELHISGIIKDFPKNASIKACVFINSEEFKFNTFCADGSDLSTYRYYYNVYIKLQQSAGVGQVKKLLNDRAGVFSPYIAKIGLLPLDDIYLYDNTDDSYTEKGNPGLLKLMTNIALVILVLSIINYINLTAAQQNKRNKETGIRKTVGASRKDMIIMYLSESILTAFIAFGMAAALLEIFVPIFGSIIDKDLSSASLYRYPLAAILPAAIFLIGIIAGIAPAIILSSFNPIRMFSGGVTVGGRKNVFRNILTVFQFAVSICLIFCLVVIQKQIKFVKEKDLGFDKEQTLTFRAPYDNSDINGIKDKLLRNPDILSVTNTQGTPGEINTGMGTGVPGKTKTFKCIYVDSSFLKTFNIPVVKGRDFLPGDLGRSCMFNESAYKYMEFKDLDGKRFNNGREGGYEIIGVVKNFNFASLHEEVSPMCLMLVDFPTSTFSIKIAKGKVGAVMEYLKKIWNEPLTEYPLKYEFFDERFDSMYRKEEKFGELIGLFSMLAIIISCMGILGLAVFSAEGRAKEIGIRKVHGA
ncbi:MAG TPA: ABC transporter permease, partial [Ignavibacteriales bacterium]|nr:ABC transporter permease [Ignavibacteriales bacterium]